MKKSIFKYIYHFIIFSLSTTIITTTVLFSNKIFIESNSSFIMHNNKIYSEIYSSSDKLVKKINEVHSNPVTFSEIPQCLIDSLLITEDKNFYNHDGIDLKRIVSSILNNLIEKSYVQGGSTITQQLVKNLYLTDEKTLSRKLNEIGIAIDLEKRYSKEEILTEYFNSVYFEPTIKGIRYACYRYFNKEIYEINYLDSALLAGLVKSPSIYNPQNNPTAAFKRRNIVLKLLLDNNKITQQEYSSYTSVPIDKQVIKKGSNYNEPTYNYQSYIDGVIKEATEILGYSPYSKPVIIKTYLNEDIQSLIDKIQDGLVISFKDDLLQIGGAVFEKDSNAIIGIMGGRSYNGEFLFNRATDLKTNPASTIKPLLSYPLALENFDLNELSLVKDELTYYPNSMDEVSNVDKNYLGNLSLYEALGLSRNTVAIQLLNKVAEKRGVDYITSYLKSINCYDGDFTFSYGLGGMKNGLSPLSLTAAYGMLLNDGTYYKPTMIKSIIDKESNTIIYQNKNEGVKVLSDETSFVIKDMLERAVNKGYNGLDDAKPAGITIGAKTGTGQYDRTLIEEYHMPSNADKDIWLTGFSNRYAIGIWTGFDKIEKDKKTYFYKGDERKKIAKQIFKVLMGNLDNNNLGFEVPSSLKKINIVKYMDKAYLPNEFIPNYLIDYTYIRNDCLLETLPPPTFTPIIYPTIFNYDFFLEIYFSPCEVDEKNKDIYGLTNYKIIITNKDGTTNEQIITDNYLFVSNLENISNIQLTKVYSKINYESPERITLTY